jgi:hypothetical protein
MTIFAKIRIAPLIIFLVIATLAKASYYLFSEIIKEGKKSTVQWLETVVVLKKKERWQIKVLHSTLIKRN